MSLTGIEVELVGQDGNAFAIIARVTRAMRRGGVRPDLIEAYKAEAMSGDYDHLLATTMEWVDEPSGDDPDEDQDVDEIDGPCVCGSYDHPTEDHPTDEPGEFLEPDEAPPEAVRAAWESVVASPAWSTVSEDEAERVFRGEV